MTRRFGFYDWLKLATVGYYTPPIATLQQTLDDNERTGDPLYVFFRARHPNLPAKIKNHYDGNDPAETWLWDEFGEEYVDGFSDGFYGHYENYDLHLDLPPSKEVDRYMVGWEDGCKFHDHWLTYDAARYSHQSLTGPRLTIEVLNAAIEKTNMILTDRVWVDLDCGCPMGIFYKANAPDDQQLRNHPREWCSLYFGGDYVTAYVSAFDECRMPDVDKPTTRAEQGACDGYSARRYFNITGQLLKTNQLLE